MENQVVTQDQPLIPVKEGVIGGVKTMVVDARDLHASLGVRKDFTTWIRDRIRQYGFSENQDYSFETILSSPKSGSAKSRPQVTSIYTLTLDMAKELTMVERNEAGRQVRRYFLECEKRLRHVEKAVALLHGERLNDKVWLYRGLVGGAIDLLEHRKDDTGYIIVMDRKNGRLHLTSGNNPIQRLMRETQWERHQTEVLITKPIRNFTYYRRFAFEILSQHFRKEDNHILLSAAIDDARVVLEALLTERKNIPTRATTEDVPSAHNHRENFLDDATGVEFVEKVWRRCNDLYHGADVDMFDDEDCAKAGFNLVWQMIKCERRMVN